MAGTPPSDSNGHDAQSLQQQAPAPVPAPKQLQHASTGAQQDQPQLPLSRRIAATDTPVIAFTRRAMTLRQDVMSLAQGIVYWGPPPRAVQAVCQQLCGDPSAHAYSANEGLPPLREAIRTKIRTQNGLDQYDVMVTGGGNQAFVNVTLTLCDETDKVVLFQPYYFDHIMTLQMAGGADRVVLGPCDPTTMHPDTQWLQGVMAGPEPPKMVVVCNPCNPTGVLLSQSELEALSSACAQGGAWLVVDNTYEDFVWGDGRRHHCVAGPHVMHIFSFSKAYGMMGWRTGYIAYPNHDGSNRLGRELLKSQDTLCICASQAGQRLALEVLQHEPEYVQEKAETLKANRSALLDALSVLPPGSVAGGEGAIYFWARLPPGWEDDCAATEWLVREAGVCVVPGSSCGGPGHVRLSFANLAPEAFKEAAQRLREGLLKMLQLPQGPL